MSRLTLAIARDVQKVPWLARAVRTVLSVSTVGVPPAGRRIAAAVGCH